MRHHFIFLLQLCIVLITNTLCDFCCCCYRKGTNFQANHNISHHLPILLMLLLLPQRYEFSSKSQLINEVYLNEWSCCCYRKGTNFQANHNPSRYIQDPVEVVVATAKVRIFKQITTPWVIPLQQQRLLLLPQRYEFSSKSQPVESSRIKGEKLLLLPQRYEFSSKSQHLGISLEVLEVVVATAKVRIFKQITTANNNSYILMLLLLLPQRYEFSSKSQHYYTPPLTRLCCCCYRKGTNFQANHNTFPRIPRNR